MPNGSAIGPGSFRYPPQSLVSRLAEDGDDVGDLDDEEAIVPFEIDRNGAAGIEEDLVVLPQRNVGTVLNGTAVSFGSSGHTASPGA